MVDISNAKFIPNTFGGSERKMNLMAAFLKLLLIIVVCSVTYFCCDYLELDLYNTKLVWMTVLIGFMCTYGWIEDYLAKEATVRYFRRHKR